MKERLGQSMAIILSSGARGLASNDRKLGVAN